LHRPEQEKAETHSFTRRSIMTRKFKKVLCPVDFSTDSFTALDYAADFPKQNEGQLILLHVVDNGHPVATDTVAELRNEQERG
jgi:nucleotide-binding universal stress UspA family protein